MFSDYVSDYPGFDCLFLATGLAETRCQIDFREFKRLLFKMRENAILLNDHGDET